MRLRIAEIAAQHRGWTMRKLAEKLDVEHQTVMYWNQGRTVPRLPMLVKLCRLLSCRIEDLLELDWRDPPIDTEGESDD